MWHFFCFVPLSTPIFLDPKPRELYEQVPANGAHQEVDRHQSARTEEVLPVPGIMSIVHGPSNIKTGNNIHNTYIWYRVRIQKNRTRIRLFKSGLRIRLFFISDSDPVVLEGRIHIQIRIFLMDPDTCQLHPDPPFFMTGNESTMTFFVLN